MTIEKIQENFVNTLLKYGVTKKDALKISSTFFFAWLKNQGVQESNPESYDIAVREFLTRFKESS